MTPALKRLIDGFNDFRARYFSERQSLYRQLVSQGQKPKVVVVACADSRVDPAIVLQVEPGDIFAIRNVANLVPPYEQDEEGDVSYHGTSAALEFAVEVLGVEHVVVFGHAHCAGVKAMISGQQGSRVPGRFIPAWTSISAKAYHRVIDSLPHVHGEELARCCEREGVLISLENLMTFPFIRERVEAGTLEVHGWYLDITEGELSAWNADKHKFERLG